MKFKYQNQSPKFSSICLKDQVLKEGFDPAYGARLGPRGPGWPLGPGLWWCSKKYHWYHASIQSCWRFHHLWGFIWKTTFFNRQIIYKQADHDENIIFINDETESTKGDP